MLGLESLQAYLGAFQGDGQRRVVGYFIGKYISLLGMRSDRKVGELDTWVPVFYGNYTARDGKKE